MAYPFDALIPIGALHSLASIIYAFAFGAHEIFAAVFFGIIFDAFLIDALHFKASLAAGAYDILAGVNGYAFLNGGIASEIVRAWLI